MNDENPTLTDTAGQAISQPESTETLSLPGFRPRADTGQLPPSVGQSDRDAGRGQVGIGTLIVFIAMVLIAATVAGVLFDTAGFLQSKSETVGEKSDQQVTNRLDVVAVAGQTTDTDGDGEVDAIGVVNLTVARGASPASIDLQNVTVQWVGPSGTYRLVHDGIPDGEAQADGLFGVTAFGDSDDSAPVLTGPDERFVLTFDLGSDTTSADQRSDADDSYSGHFGAAFGDGGNVQLAITTQSGVTVTRVLVVPQSLSGRSAVAL